MTRKKSNFTWSGKPKAGRKPQAGARYPGGKLKPKGPNPLVVDRRRALAKDITMATCPLDVAHTNGWLDDGDYQTGIMFARLHRAAGFGQVGAAMGASMQVPAPTELSLSVALSDLSFFSGLPHAEIVELWDRVFDAETPDRDGQTRRAEKANRQWRAANAAMTLAERSEVEDVCIHDSFPQWVIQRAAGRLDTSWERKRDLLISGLRKVKRALVDQAQVNGPVVFEQVPATPRAPTRAEVEHTVYVDEAGEKLFEAERVVRRAG